MGAELRALTFADWGAVHDWARREEACRYQAWGPNTPEQTKSFVQDAVDAWAQRPQTRFVYAVTLDGKVIGIAELKLRGGRQGEISYGIHPDLWGRGLATDAARQLLTIGFTEHNLHRIFGTCDPRNEASARVLTRIGMRYEGRMRGTIQVRDGWRDSDLYAVLQTDNRHYAEPHVADRHGFR
ncbi:MAG TPA: GNAT family N-acetyltransferase [Candidatus Limnocylindrales bacterium]